MTTAALHAAHYRTAISNRHSTPPADFSKFCRRTKVPNTISVTQHIECRTRLVLIPSYFFCGTIRWRVQRFFRSEEEVTEHFRSVYEDSTGDIVEKPGKLPRGSVADQFVDVMVKDLLVLWNYASDTFKARSKPDALFEFAGPDDKNRAIQQAARTVIKVSNSQPGAVILVTITSLIPRAKKFFRETLKGLRTREDEFLKYLNPLDLAAFYPSESHSTDGVPDQVRKINCPYEDIHFCREFYEQIISPQLSSQPSIKPVQPDQSGRISAFTKENIEEGIVSMID